MLDQFLSEPKVGQLSDAGFRLLLAMLNGKVDAKGRGRAHPIYWRSAAWPFREIQIEEVQCALKELVSAGEIIPYQRNKEWYIVVPRALKIQSETEQKTSTTPAPPTAVLKKALDGFQHSDAIIKELVDDQVWSAEKRAKHRGQIDRRAYQLGLGLDWEGDSASSDYYKRAPMKVVHRLYAIWVQVTGRHPGKTKLTKKRERMLKDRVKEYGPERVLAAIKGVRLDPWNSGQDPRTGGKRYDDLTLICRNGENIERFADLYEQAQRGEILPDEIEDDNTIARRLRKRRQLNGD